MVAVIHQPHFLPWLGYFNKISNCNNFIIQDNVQYRKEYFQNRTIILDKNHNPVWLTIPVHHKLETKINQIYTAKYNWHLKFLNTIYHSYNKYKHFDDHFDGLQSTINICSNSLLEINTNLILFILEKLDINVKLHFSSTFSQQQSSTEDIINICKQTRSTDLIFGEGGGLRYHGINMFKSYSINLHQQNFKNSMELFSKRRNEICFNLSIVHYLFSMDIEDLKLIINNTWKIKYCST